MLKLKWFKWFFSFRSHKFNNCRVLFNGQELTVEFKEDEKGNLIVNFSTNKD